MTTHPQDKTQVQLGKIVPPVTLLASNGEEISLSQFLGKKLIIYFYPKDNTPTCTQESCDFRDYTSQFRANGAELIGISPDPIKSHHKFIEKHTLPFLLLSDIELTAAHLFDVWRLKKLYGREYMGVERSTFLLDAQGMLVREWRRIKIKNHVNEVLEAVKMV